MSLKAIGLLHLGISERILADQTLIERLAKAHDYTLVRILTIDHETFMPTTLIIGTAARSRAVVIITPDLNHFGHGYKAIPRACPVLLPTGLLPGTTAYTTKS